MGTHLSKKVWLARKLRTGGVWSLTARGQQTKQVNKDKVKRFVVEQDRKPREEVDGEALTIPEELTWEDELLSALKSMSADAFERLCQRLLRESGFIQVEVTGKSGPRDRC